MPLFPALNFLLSNTRAVEKLLSRERARIDVDRVVPKPEVRLHGMPEWQRIARLTDGDRGESRIGLLKVLAFGVWPLHEACMAR